MRPFATIILAGGKGTRMGSRDRHKVCFEVAGVPVIIRALETCNLCGTWLNIVVVGTMAENVMGTVGPRFPGTAYAFQEKPLGTGDAARKGAEILERMRFDGDVLVVAGDKVMDPKVIRQLLAAHARSEADGTLATAKRPPGSSAGIVLEAARGNIAGVLEEPERQRLAALAQINEAFGRGASLTRRRIQAILDRQCGPRTASAMAEELGIDTSSLSREEFERRFSPEERLGQVRVGTGMVAANEVLSRFGQMNLSVYLFRAPVLYDALERLKQFRRGQEEYLTDVVEILTRRRVPARVVGCEIKDGRDLMAFNNPQELLAVEEVYRQKEGSARLESASEPGEVVAPGRVWQGVLEAPPLSTQRQFQRWYGEEVPWGLLRGVVGEFTRRYGGSRPIAVVRSPGRINLMGRHIDHQGGTVNVMAVNREIILVAAPRTDDVVSLANTNGSVFSEEVFRISDLIAQLNWDDWQRVVDGPRLERLLEAARGDWANYAKAAVLRLQEQFRDRRLRGLDLVVSGDIPMGAGLSSSSALVVATAEAVRVFNRLPVSARRLVSLCGEGEWFVGTRGGAADHAAIKLSRRGCVTRVGFFPFRVEASARFFPDHDLVVCNSGLYAGKSNEARNVFNGKVTAYHIGRAWFKMLRPDLAGRIEHLRDINREHLGLTHAVFAGLLGQLPERIGRREVQRTFGQMAGVERERLERMFRTHDAPAAGYAVRGVVIFGLSEMARARRCLELLRGNEPGELGRCMAVSHDGDRVLRLRAGTGNAGFSRQGVATISRSRAGTGGRGPFPGQGGRRFAQWAAKPGRAADIGQLAGDYGCSLPVLDRIVDLAQRQPGVEGAQLAGAGLGGCIMVLVRKTHTADLLKALGEEAIKADVFRPIAGACTLRMGER
jgi:N-acetylgalactosamine kinase